MNRLQLGGQSIPGNLPTWGGAAALVLLALGFGLGYLLLDSQDSLLPETTVAAAPVEPAPPPAPLDTRQASLTESSPTEHQKEVVS